MKTYPLAIRILLALVLALTTIPAHAQTPPVPPAQPESGPGGKEAAYGHVLSTRVGESPRGAWVFAPERDDDPQLPVVVFLHGFSAVYPESYQAWIDHIVLRGAIAIYPDYQSANPIETAPADFLQNAVSGIDTALTLIGTGEFGPANSATLALVGHSLGGLLALNLAATATAFNLPPASVVLAAEPGGCRECGGLSILLGQPLENLASIPATAVVTIVTGDEDTVVADVAAQLAWPLLGHIPDQHRALIELRTDRHGSPPLVADHYMPETGGESGEVDALDWFGTWALLDAMTDCAFAESCDDLPADSGELNMGEWSDGTPVLPAAILG